MCTMRENPTEAWSTNSDRPSSASGELIPLLLRRAITGESIEIAAPSAIIGRHSEADVRLSDPDVSRQHCRITVEDGMWRIVDLRSTNGVYLNDVRRTEATLYPGDRLQIGSVELVVERAMPKRSIKGPRGRAEAILSIARAVSQPGASTIRRRAG